MPKKKYFPSFSISTTAILAYKGEKGKKSSQDIEDKTPIRSLCGVYDKTDPLSKYISNGKEDYLL